MTWGEPVQDNTERNDRMRIISARKARRHEQKEYYRSQVDE